MKYNTQKERLALPEYGRYIHEMVAHACELPKRDDRQRCAETIVSLMANRLPQQKRNEEFKAKLWNQLAYIARYELDIDYPYAITPRDIPNKGVLCYPKHAIKAKHYGHLVEQIIAKVAEVEDMGEKEALIDLLVFQMRKSLAEWNPDALNDEKIADDIAKLSDGRIQLDPSLFKLSNIDYNKLKHSTNTTPYKKGKGKKYH